MSVLQRDGVALHYETTGSLGPNVVLIQGVGVTGSGWQSQVQFLAGSMQCLSFDNRGIGASVPCTTPISIGAMADDVVALMDAAGFAKAHVIGHSMGGLIAQEVALRARARVQSLSLLCTFQRGPEAARITPWVLWMTLRTRVGSRLARRRAFLEMLFTDEFLAGKDRDALAVELGPIVGRDLADSPPVLMQQLRAMSAYDQPERLAELAGIPTLVVSGAHDKIANPRYGNSLAAAIPNATFELQTGSAHGLILFNEGNVNERLRTFIGAAEGTPPRG
jgi:pimeloyl-ACP methyl ester carboxylesterase